MKQKDITLIAVVIIVSALVSFIVCNKFLPNTKPKVEKAEVVEPIVATFNLPDKKYFNERSINPTQLIRIGGSPDNLNPFTN